MHLVRGVEWRSKRIDTEQVLLTGYLEQVYERIRALHGDCRILQCVRCHPAAALLMSVSEEV